MNIDYTLHTKLTKENQAIVAAATCSLEESQAALAEFMAWDNMGIPKDADGNSRMMDEEERKAWKKEYLRITKGMELAEAVDTLKRLNETANAKLMKVTTKYLITLKSDKLQNPAGFALDSRVYLQTELAIQTNKAPKTLRGNLSLYEIK